MVHEHPNPNPNDDPNPIPLLLYGIGGSLLVVACIYVVAALNSNVEYEYQRERLYSGALTEISQLRADQRSEINSYRWVDQQAEIVGVPVDEVFDQVAQELRDDTDGVGPWSSRSAQGEG